MDRESSILFLEDGGQTAGQVADALTSFLAGARGSLDIAIYDCALTGDAATAVASALRAAMGRGVSVRVAYYAGPHVSPVIRPPQGSSEAFLQPLGVPTRAVSGFQALMHDKYVVRDAGSGAGAVWTGSTNWSVDSWTREENVALMLLSDELAALYRRDFDELWNSGRVENTGGDAGGNATVQISSQPVPATVWFSPACGEAMAHAVADVIRAATRRISLASPVLTDGSILGALRDIATAGSVPIRGVYDRTQMEEALQQWGSAPGGSWKPAAFEALCEAAHLAGKVSTPYSPTSVHDYMHAKVIVADDVVFTGSYNFSHSGEENAENLLRIDSAPLAEECVAFVERLIARYGAS